MKGMLVQKRGDIILCQLKPQLIVNSEEVRCTPSGYEFEIQGSYL